VSVRQISLFEDGHAGENPEFLRSQLITYIGNKRALLPFIQKGIILAKEKLKKDKAVILDLFSGSGAVARMAKQHSSHLIVNDLEQYSFVCNSCYLSNKSSLDLKELREYMKRVRDKVEANLSPGFITKLYAPKDENNIQKGERVFYTRRNAMFLDTFCTVIKGISEPYRTLLLAPVLVQASMYVNTSGVFKGFYKNKSGIGQYGGDARNSLTRILKKIEIIEPVFSNYECRVDVVRSDANALCRNLEWVDIAYFDPPYNQHPYGSNYFMLNLLCNYEEPIEISKTSGIPKNWSRSAYNKPQSAQRALFDAIRACPSSFVLISYNSEGFIEHDTFVSELRNLGAVEVLDTEYNTFRGSRNLRNRDRYVTEFLYLVDKR
jgi:adenine-specific DNA-methyltransferase